jgi:hypothetical protein
VGMILGLTSLSDANIARVLEDPPLIWRVVAPEDPEVYEQARAAAVARPSFFQKLFGRRRDEAPDGGAAAPFVMADGEGVATDLDKAWHGIHYLLTGTDWEGDSPLNLLAAGGRVVGDIDMGYGPARVLTAAETRAAHEALSALGDDALRARFDPAAMMEKEIYPEIWDRDPDDDDTLGYLMEYVAILRRFLADAVKARHGAVIYLS